MYTKKFCSGTEDMETKTLAIHRCFSSFALNQGSSFSNNNLEKKLLTAIQTVGLLCPFMGILRRRSLVFNPHPANASSMIVSNFLYLFVNCFSAMTSNILQSINCKFSSTCTEWAFQSAKGSIEKALI